MQDWVGRSLGVLTLTPYAVWRRTHSIHHASHGNLDQRHIGDVTTLTLEEYRALSRFQRLMYRLYRNPVVLFGLGPSYLFLLQNRIPRGLMRSGWRYWISAMGTNAMVALMVAAIAWYGGLQAVLLIFLPTTVTAATIGVWLFYVQHQFEDSRWFPGPTGNCTMRRSRAARITSCRSRCAGSRAISASTTSTTFIRASRSIASAK